jgi:hypothetical protein
VVHVHVQKYKSTSMVDSSRPAYGVNLREASDREKLPWDTGSMKLFSEHFMLNSLSQPNAMLCSWKFLSNCKILAGVESSSVLNPLQL